MTRHNKKKVKKPSASAGFNNKLGSRQEALQPAVVVTDPAPAKSTPTTPPVASSSPADPLLQQAINLLTSFDWEQEDCPPEPLGHDGMHEYFAHAIPHTLCFELACLRTTITMESGNEVKGYWCHNDGWIRVYFLGLEEELGTVLKNLRTVAKLPGDMPWMFPSYVLGMDEEDIVDVVRRCYRKEEGYKIIIPKDAAELSAMREDFVKVCAQESGMNG